MTDEKPKPDDVVDGFDLPGGEPTPPPEGESLSEDMSGFDLPASDDVPSLEVAPMTEATDGFDLPDTEVVAPLDTVVVQAGVRIGKLIDALANDLDPHKNDHQPRP